jgi:hypothetical protein
MIGVPGTNYSLEVALWGLAAKIGSGEPVKLDIAALVQLIVERKSDLDIWSAALDLVKPDPPPASTPFPARIRPDVQDTPFRFSSGSLRGGKHKVDQETAALRTELESALNMDDQEFLTTYVANISKIARTAAAFFCECYSGDQPLFNVHTRRWNNWDEPGEKAVQKYVERLVDKLHNFLDAEEIQRDSR